MIDDRLIRLFRRHFADPVAAARRLDVHLASVELPFEFHAQLRELPYPPEPGLPNGMPSFIYYFVPNSRRGTDQPPKEDPLHPSFINACDGIGLNLGCPVRLLRALDALVQLSTENQQPTRAGLRTSSEHLSTVEELLWLTGWKSPSAQRRGGQFANVSGDVDWALQANGYPIYVEAKFRRSDWPRLSDGKEYSRLGDGLLSSAAHKFPNPPHVTALHIVGITTFDNIDEDIMHGIGHELEATPQIHAVVIRSMLQMTHVISMSVEVRDRVLGLLNVPNISDFPVNHGVLYHREQRDKRIANRQPRTETKKSKAVCWSIRPLGIIPFQMAEIYRLDIPTRGPHGEPQFRIIPKFLMLPPNLMRHYVPNHQVTSNYVEGMRAIASRQLSNALDILSSEPADSPCYGLALANKALAELRLDRFRASEKTAKLALAEFDAKSCPHPPTWVQTFRNLGEALSRQGRLNESLSIFNNGCHVADLLAKDFPDFERDCLLEKAHTFNSWGGALLKGDGAGAAIDCFTGGRDIYRHYPDNQVGYCETLTNLAQAYTVVGKKTEAGFAIDEAKQHVNGDEEQLHRINIAGARLGLFSKDESRRVLMDAATAAERAGFFETAYVRYCIAAFLAHEHKDHVWGTEVVRLADALESKLDPHSLQPPKLSFYRASFFEQSGHPPETVINSLIDGARLWCERLPGPLAISDYQQAVVGMHDHFRKLGSMLIEQGRNEEAFIAFEIGRARSFTIEVHGDHTHPLLSANPFGANTVDCALLKRIQSGLKQGECMVSLAILPPNLVAFILGKDSLQVSRVNLVANLAEANLFGDAVRALASELESGKGINGIPKQITELCREIATILGSKSIVLLAPHAMLHKVPWRALLRETGIPWSQLPFITQFSPLLDPDRPNPDAEIISGAVALGHGFAGTGTNRLNLEEEAREFIEQFAGNGRLIRGARSADIVSGLSERKSVLISCHGSIASTEQGDRFLFELADGNHAPDELITNSVAAPLVILSACSSGVYEMAAGDYPVGAAPEFILAGARFCICTRFPVSAYFTKVFFPTFGKLLQTGCSVGVAFARTLQEVETQGYDRWAHLACVELLGRGISDSK